MTSLRELVEAATPGPWVWNEGYFEHEGEWVAQGFTDPKGLRDARLIAVVPELAAVALAAGRVESALADLLDWAERYRGGDTSITSEHYYIYRDEARIARVACRDALAVLRARLNPEATE